MDDLVGLLWPDDAGTVGPYVLRERLYGVVSRLRRLLDDEDEDGLRLVTDEEGYRLVAGRAALDRVAFEADAARSADGDHRAATRALALWQGEPYGGFRWSEEVERQRLRLGALRRHLRRQHDPGRDAPAPVPTRTKFLRRQVAAESYVARPRLLERLGPVGSTAVLVLTAPGGFGKSVLLSQWAAAQQAPVGWVGLDDCDNDPVRFWWAVLQAFADTGALDVSDVASGVTAGSPAFVTALTEGLAGTPGPVGLVLDDFHRISHPLLLAQVASALRNLPDTCTVALAGRRSPPAAVEVEAVSSSRLDASDLRFRRDEVVELVRAAGGVVDAETLLGRTNGWPLAVAHLGRSREGISHLDPDRIIHDYVLHELERFVPEEVGAFLLRTAMLEEFTVELAAAVVEHGDVRAHLGWLLRHGLFLVEMAAGWYRYHDLVGDVLRRVAEDTPAIDVDEAHRRAARWYRDQDRPEQALRHAVVGGDDDVVADVAGVVLLSAVTRSEIRTCRHWLETIDPEVLLRDRAAHDLATLAAGGWLDRARCAAWVRSRACYGEGDLLPRMIEGHVAYLEGRARECVAINEDCLGRVDAYFDAHPGLPGVRELATSTLRSSRMAGRILAGELHHDDPELMAFAEPARQQPLLSVWAFGEWAFLAFVEGNTVLASDLVGEVVEHLDSMDELSRCLGAGRLLVARSLVESEASDEVATQRRIVRRLEPVAAEHRRLGWDVELVPVLLALRVAHRRLGDLAAAAALTHEADVLLDLCQEAPLLVAARHRLDRGAMVGAGRAGSPDEEDEQELTPRERSVIDQLRTSRTYDEIAARLGVSRHTVAEHLKAIYRKLGVRSRYGAVRRYRSWSPSS